MFDIKGAGATPAENIKDPEGRGATFYGFSVHACLPSGEISHWSALPARLCGCHNFSFVSGF